MPRSSSLFLTLLGAVTSTFACVIPTTPLSNTILQQFQIKVQNPAIPAIHDGILNFRPNGDDKHLVLRPMGVPTYDLIYLDDGLLTYDGRHAVIDLEFNPNDNTTKMFMTDRTYYHYAVFQPVYGCDPDDDTLQIRLQLVKRTADTDNDGDPEQIGGQIGIQTAGDTYEFRYSPANNSLLVNTWLAANLVIFRDGVTPPVGSPTSTIVATPTGIPSTIDDYGYVSCWAEPADGSRTLTSSTTVNGLTNEECAILCDGTIYFGTQYSVECWCGNTLGAGSLAAPESSCSSTCSGDATEFCGGGRILSLYKRKAAGSSPSVTSSTSSILSTSSSSSSTSSSAAATSSIISSTSSSSSASSSTFVTSTITSSSAVVSTTTSSSVVVTSSSSTSSSAAPTSTGTVPSGPYTYVSCYAEPPAGRALTGALYASTAMTPALCASECALFPYFGLEWSSECWCGMTLTAGSLPAAESNCNYPCAGYASTSCGGSGYLSLYTNAAFAAPAQPAVVGAYDFYGCVVDDGARSLGAKSVSSASMTLKTCAAFCTGYEYFGAEWGVECWCGNAIAATGVAAPAGECSMLCAGDGGEFCGNGDRLSVYKLAAM